MKRPWLKFYPADWRSDPRLRMCSLAARGLWIDLISYMHEGEPYGHLRIGGIHPTPGQIANLIGRPEREVAAAFIELTANGVCDQSADGAIVSRRMVRDAIRSDEGREQVNKRWGNRGPNRYDDETPNMSPTAEPKSIPPAEPITQRLETRDQTEKKEATGSSEPVTARKLKYPAAFEGWWLAYPRTPVMSKKEAISAWNRLSEPDRLLAVAALPKYREFLKSKSDHPVVHACRFLSQRRFDGFEEIATEPASLQGFYAEFGSQELDAWDAYRMDFEGKKYPRDKRGGWSFPTRWPTGYEVKNGHGAHDGEGGAQTGAKGLSGREIAPDEGFGSGSGGAHGVGGTAPPQRSPGRFAIE